MRKSFELTKAIAVANAHAAWEQIDELVERAYGVALEDILERYERHDARPRARIRFAPDFAKTQGRQYRRSIRRGWSKDAYVLELLQGAVWVFSAAWHPRRNRDGYTLPCAVLDRICELLSLGYDLCFSWED